MRENGKPTEFEGSAPGWREILGRLRRRERKENSSRLGCVSRSDVHRNCMALGSGLRQSGKTSMKGLKRYAFTPFRNSSDSGFGRGTLPGGVEERLYL